MPRPLSKIAPDWWDYTTIEPEILDDAARLTPEDMLLKESSPGISKKLKQLLSVERACGKGVEAGFDLK